MLRTSNPSQSPLMVLIDDDNQSAKIVARKLRAGGNKRVVIHIGGEEMIKRKGRSGLGRIGGTSIPMNDTFIPPNHSTGDTQHEIQK